MGRFLLGFAIGAVIGAVVALLFTPASGENSRQDLTKRLGEALEAGKAATNAREQELWVEFRRQLNREASADDQNNLLDQPDQSAELA